MHLLPLGAASAPASPWPSLNAPFGARCFLTDQGQGLADLVPYDVLMHLLALGAFRLASTISTSWGRACLNAPYGAWCFPTA